jgi:hypothetical protein
VHRAHGAQFVPFTTLQLQRGIIDLIWRKRDIYICRYTLPVSIEAASHRESAFEFHTVLGIYFGEIRIRVRP